MPITYLFLLLLTILFQQCLVGYGNESFYPPICFQFQNEEYEKQLQRNLIDIKSTNFDLKEVSDRHFPTNSQLPTCNIVMPFKSSGYFEDIPSEQLLKSQLMQNIDQRRYVYRNIILINDENDERTLTEGAPIAVDNFNYVFFNDVIVYLCQQDLLPSGSSLFFFDEERSIFVHQGREPVPSHIMIPLSKFSRQEIKIKYRPPQKSNIFSHNSAQNVYQQSQSLMRISQRVSCKEESGYNNCINTGAFKPSIAAAVDLDEEEMNLESNNKVVPREKRVKERKIGYVRDRVLEWRRYYDVGVPFEQGRFQKVNLDVAASKVGLSRKTLDDYFKYIKKAESFGFDFETRSEEKIGVLRNFVRDRQKRNQSLSKHQISKDFDEDCEDLQEEEFTSKQAEVSYPEPIEAFRLEQSQSFSCAPPIEYIQPIYSEQFDMDMEVPAIGQMSNSGLSMSHFDFIHQQNNFGYCYSPTLQKGNSVNYAFSRSFNHLEGDQNTNWRYDDQLNIQLDLSASPEQFEISPQECEDFLVPEMSLRNSFNGY